jgi:hypothetical protein
MLRGREKSFRRQVGVFTTGLVVATVGVGSRVIVVSTGRLISKNGGWFSGFV